MTAPRTYLDDEYHTGLGKDQTHITQDDKVLYRAFGQYQEDGSIEIGYEVYRVTKDTPCGSWISTPYKWNGVQGQKKFVNLTAVKQWASIDQVQALDQLKHRKIRQVRILETRLAEARAVLEHLKEQDKP